MVNKHIDYKITCEYYYDNNSEDYFNIIIENQNGYKSNEPCDWTEIQRIKMLRNLAKALKLNVNINSNN